MKFEIGNQVKVHIGDLKENYPNEIFTIIGKRKEKNCQYIVDTTHLKIGFNIYDDHIIVYNVKKEDLGKRGWYVSDFAMTLVSNKLKCKVCEEYEI